MAELEAKYKALAKPEYAPLVDLILAKKVKRAKDIKGMSMPPPLGGKPKSCTTEIAVEFVKVFIPNVWKMIAVPGKKKKSMKKLRERLKAGKDAGDFGGDATAVGGAGAASPQTPAASKQSASPSSKESKVVTPCPNSSVSTSDLSELLGAGLNAKSSELWSSAFSMFDTDGSGKLGAAGVSNFFGKFGETLADDEIQHVLSQLNKGNTNAVEDADPAATGVSLLDFAQYMNGSIRQAHEEMSLVQRPPRFGAAYELFTQKSALLDSDRAKAAMLSLCEEVTMEEAAEMAAEAPSKQRFVQVLEAHLLNEVTEGAGVGGGRRAAAPPLPSGGGNGGGCLIDGVDVTKFKKMLKMHVPKGAVRMKMKSEGVANDVIEHFLQ